MKPDEDPVIKRLAQVASELQQQRTGHAPHSVTVVLGDDTLVVTLHGALSPAEQVLVGNLAGAAQVQEYHRQLFANSAEEMKQEIKKITGRDVIEAATEIETTSGTFVRTFTTGAMVQVYLLTNGHDKPDLAKNWTKNRQSDEVHLFLEPPATKAGEFDDLN